MFSPISCKSNNSNFTAASFKCSKIHEHPTLLYSGNKKSAELSISRDVFDAYHFYVKGWFTKYLLLHFETAINEVYL